jgi:hypothetical protein
VFLFLTAGQQQLLLILLVTFFVTAFGHVWLSFVLVFLFFCFRHLALGLETAAASWELWAGVFGGVFYNGHFIHGGFTWCLLSLSLSFLFHIFLGADGVQSRLWTHEQNPKEKHFKVKNLRYLCVSESNCAYEGVSRLLRRVGDRQMSLM